jgi:formiminoglutamase
MELAQRAYLVDEAPPWTLDPARAGALRRVLGGLLADLDRLARSGAAAPPTA